MPSHPILDAIAGWFSTIVISASGVAAFLYFLLKKTLEKTIDSRFDENLENIKHELQLEQQKMSIVYQQQKDSFRKVLMAMHNAIEAIAANIEGDGGDWLPITEDKVSAFSRVLAEESLFMEERSDHALRLFREIMWTAVRYEDTYPRSDVVWRSYNQMKFISDRLAEHFRLRVGLESRKTDSLFEIELLGACRLINRFTFPDSGMPTNGPLRYQDHGSATQLVALAREHPEELRSELSKLRNALISHSSIFFEDVVDVDWHMERVKSL